MSDILKKEMNDEIIVNFGEDFGVLSKQNISDIFVDIHASISPLDPLNKATVEESIVAPSEQFQ